MCPQMPVVTLFGSKHRVRFFSKIVVILYCLSNFGQKDVWLLCMARAGATYKLSEEFILGSRRNYYDGQGDRRKSCENI